MNILAKKLNSVFLFVAIIAVALSFGFVLPAHAQYEDYYDGGYYDSSYYGDYSYDGGYYDDSYYDGGYYDNSYYDSGFDSGYGAYDNGSTCYDCGGYDYGYYDYNTCYDCGYSSYNDYHDTCGNNCNNNYVAPVIVSCTPNTYNTQTGQAVTWSAHASGGNGGYQYSWSGTDGLSGSGSSQSKSYSSSGSKSAHVVVTSGGKTGSADCGSVYVNQNQQSLSGSCYVNESSVDEGDSVHWYASASGGTGSYSYEWSGSSPLSGRTGSNPVVSYSSTGSKTGTVTIRSGDQSITRSCGSVDVNNDNNDNNDDLDVSCSISDYNVEVGDQIRVRAYGSGGDGDYSYTWYGSSPLDGETGSSQYVTYNSSGDKEIRVKVKSDGETKTRNCGTVHVGKNYNDNYDDFNISCTVNTPNANLGQVVTWNTSISGGNGNYYYSWSGTDNIYGNSSSISKSYGTTGTKNVTVTVTSDGRTRSLNCPTVTVNGGSAYVGPNQGNLASLSSVYLNQVPYTGVGDNPKFIAFIVGLLLWSAAMAYAIIYRKSKTARRNAILDFKRENMAKRGLL